MELVVYIGRFQPFHLGHLKTCTEALEQYDHLMICCGGANSAPSLRNPWSYDERVSMMSKCFSSPLLDRITFMPLYDSTYDDEAWKNRLQHAIFEQFPNANVTLIGYEKDQSSFYLKLFPEWQYHPVPFYEKINATDIRISYFEGNALPNNTLPEPIFNWLSEFKRSTAYPLFCTIYQRMALQSHDPSYVTNYVFYYDQTILIEKRDVFSKQDQWSLPESKSDQNINESITHQLQLLFLDPNTIPYRIHSLGEYQHAHRSMVPEQTSKVYVIVLEKMPSIQKTVSAKFQHIDTLFMSPLYADHASIINAVKTSKIV